MNSELTQEWRKRHNISVYETGRPPDLSTYTPAQLAAIADELNDRPRKRFGYHTPREEFAKLLDDDQRVATTP